MKNRFIQRIFWIIQFLVTVRLLRLAYSVSESCLCRDTESNSLIRGEKNEQQVTFKNSTYCIYAVKF